jgi:hypothetical protein
MGRERSRLGPAAEIPEHKKEPYALKVGSFHEVRTEDMEDLLERVAFFVGRSYRGCPAAMIRPGRWSHLHHPAETENFTHLLVGSWAIHVPTLFVLTILSLCFASRITTSAFD